ncbi:MAG: sigma-54 dependent transcriptional regulator [Pseudomonadota bacterium]
MAKILVIDDEHSICETLEMFLSEKGHRVFTAATGKEGVARACEIEPDIVILDIRLPDANGLDLLTRIRETAALTKVIMITAYQDMETTIQAMKRGAFDYIHKPLDADVVEKTIDRALRVLKADRSAPAVKAAPAPVDPEVIIGRSEPMRDIFKMIGLVCQNRAAVLIQGETGTGKELIARVIHKNSPRQKDAFVTVDCSAVVATLLESELFGHEKGAFTGATHTQKGKIEQAGSGTLFLDEIGELPLAIQGKFLGFLQRQQYMRVGGSSLLESRCRIIAATNQDLFSMVEKGAFRQDLFYRLRVVTILVPPLRHRLEDIPDLVGHFLQKANMRLATGVTRLQNGVMDRLCSQPWTGNVRELENVLVEAAVRARGSVILLDDIEDILRSRERELDAGVEPESLPEMEKEHIRSLLDKLDWNRSETARRLKISLPTLRSKIRKYGLVPPEGLAAETEPK